MNSIAEAIQSTGIEAMVAAINNRWQEKLNLVGEDIKKAYPVTDDNAVLDIIEAMERQTECQKCIKEGRQICLHSDEKAYHIAPDGKITKYPCPKKQRERLEENCKTANIPKRYRHLTLEDYDSDKYNQQAIKKAQKAINQGIGLFIHGSYGTGKTMLASILAQQLIVKGVPVYFTSIAELLYKLETFPREDNTLIFDRIDRAKFLVIDDLGAEGTTPRIESLIFKLINDKYNNNNPVIVTTNLRADEDPPTEALKRVFSRLKGTCVEVTLGGADRRQLLLDL